MPWYVLLTSHRETGDVRLLSASTRDGTTHDRSEARAFATREAAEVVAFGRPSASNPCPPPGLPRGFRSFEVVHLDPPAPTHTPPTVTVRTPFGPIRSRPGQLLLPCVEARPCRSTKRRSRPSRRTP